jgi:hypothetical protein
VAAETRKIGHRPRGIEFWIEMIGRTLRTFAGLLSALRRQIHAVKQISEARVGTQLIPIPCHAEMD